MHFVVRQDTACPEEQIFYSCGSNGYHGCCAENPCHVGGCPGVSNPEPPPSARKPSSTPHSTNLLGNTLAPAIVLVTSTLNGGTLLTFISTSLVPSTSSLPSNSIGKNSAAVTPTSSPLPKTSAKSSSKSNAKAIIGGVIGGVAGVVITVVLIWLCILRKKKQKERRKNPTFDDNAGIQDIGANRNGDAIENHGTPNIAGKGSQRTASKEQSKRSTINIGGKGYNLWNKWPFSPSSLKHTRYNEKNVPFLDSQPIQPEQELAGSSVDPAGLKPELSGVSTINHVAELPSDPERSFINSPKGGTNSAMSGSNADAGENIFSHQDQLSMPPTLITAPTSENQNPQARNDRRHAMSWMNYED